MKLKRGTPSFMGLHPASASARRAARGASKKMDSRCELVLRRALWAMGLRYRKCVPELAGRPDLIFPRHRAVVFCDGNFSHGRDLDSRLARLAQGHNAPYCMKKIRTNVRRDHAVSERLTREGWHVVRLSATDILRDPEGAAAVVAARLQDTGAAASNNSMQRPALRAAADAER